MTFVVIEQNTLVESSCSQATKSSGNLTLVGFDRIQMLTMAFLTLQLVDARGLVRL
jgi:hypothetical protein